MAIELDDDGELALRRVLGYVNAASWLPLSVREAVKALGSKMPEPRRIDLGHDETFIERIGRLGTDSVLWTAEFLMAQDEADDTGRVFNVDDELLAQWFALAMGAGRLAEKKARVAYINELEARLGINQGD